MASPSSPATDHRRNIGKSYFQQTVCLADWWLVKAENDVQGRRLAVAGLTDRGKQAIRVFISAPILKRYDAFTIESTDGICIILKGFINKARTLENGFPSDVFNHFVFGFPLYWKDYDEKFVGKEPPSKDIVADKPLDQLSQKLGSTNCSAMGGTQPHLDSHDKDFRSQGKIAAKGRPKSKRAKSVAVPLPKKYSVSGLHKESYCGGTCVEDHTAPELPGNCLKKNEVKSLSGLICDGSIKVPAVIDKSTDYSLLGDSRGTLFACHLYNKKTQQGAKTTFDWDMSTLEKISSDNEVSVMTHSEDKGIGEIKTRSKTPKAKIKAMDLPSTPASASKSHHTPAAVDNQRDPVITRRYSLLEKAKALDMVTGQKSVPVSKVGPSATVIPETCYKDKGITEIKAKVTSYSNTYKAKNKETESPSTPAAPTKLHNMPAAVDNQKDTIITGKNSLSEKAKALGNVTKQKSVPETPETEKEKGWRSSPQSGSFNRSRSGRLLIPTMEFWRNQRAIYTKDRTITGIQEGFSP